jgi:hypothetical protein
MRGELEAVQVPIQEKLLATALKAIKHLAASPPLIEVLQNSNAMEVLVSLLGKTMKEDKKVVSVPSQLSKQAKSVRKQVLTSSKPSGP